MYQRSMRFDRRVWGDTNILAATDPPFGSSEPHQSIASKAPGLLLPVPFQPAHLAGCSYKTDKDSLTSSKQKSTSSSLRKPLSQNPQHHSLTTDPNIILAG